MKVNECGCVFRSIKHLFTSQGVNRHSHNSLLLWMKNKWWIDTFPFEWMPHIAVDCTVKEDTIVPPPGCSLNKYILASSNSPSILDQLMCPLCLSILHQPLKPLRMLYQSAQNVWHPGTKPGILVQSICSGVKYHHGHSGSSSNTYNTFTVDGYCGAAVSYL